MYELRIDRANGKTELKTFKTIDERDDYIENNWTDEDEWCVPGAFGGWIDIRDMY